MTLPGSFGIGTLGTSPYGSGLLPFGVLGATALNPHLVEVQFSDLLDFADPAILNPANYTLIPGLTITSVTIESAQSVRLVTSAQSAVIYEVDVTTARSLNGTLLNPALNKAFFTGFPEVAGYFSLGTAPTRVRLVFTAPMAIDAALTDPASYLVRDIQGTGLTVLSAAPEQATHPRSVVLTLGSPMRTTQWYETTLVGALLTEGGLTPQPATSVFQYIKPEASFGVPLDVFTGEVQGGLFGTPAGLVFFSPALQASIPNSIIQVDQVDACTTAYDQYTPPSPPDPAPFFTWSALGSQTTLGQQGISLWAPFPRLMEARFELTFPATSMVEPMPPAFDESCSILMRQQWDISFVALLNNPAWKLWDNTSVLVPPLFICAQNNAGPIPPGVESITVLHQGLVAGAVVHAPAHLTLGPAAAVVGGASVQADLSIP